MKRIFILLLSIAPLVAQAQSLGQVHLCSRVFSTGVWHPTEESFKMSDERRTIALRCVEHTFGTIREYEEYYGGCGQVHCLKVILDSGDILFFADGCLEAYTIVSSRFLIAADIFVGGLRVGKKPNLRCKNGGFFRQNEKNPLRYDVGRMKVDYYGHFTLDEDGLIKEIGMAFNGC